MSIGKIVEYNEATEIYRVEIDNYGTYDAICVTTDRLSIGSTVEVVDLDNKPPDQQKEESLRILPSAGARAYTPTKRWVSAKELESRGKKATLAKSWIFSSKGSLKWQKDCPRYRWATISQIIDEQDVKVNIYDPYEDKYVEHEARVDYMTCNATAFQVGDEVVCYFPRADIRFPVVVGFWKDAKTCGGWLYHALSTDPESSTWGFLWNPETNDFVLMYDNEGNPITFPREFDDTFLSAIEELGGIFDITSEDYYADADQNEIGSLPRKSEAFSLFPDTVIASSWHTECSPDADPACVDCVCCPNAESCTHIDQGGQEREQWFYNNGFCEDSWSGENEGFDDLTDTEYESREKRCFFTQTSPTTGYRTDEEFVTLESDIPAVKQDADINDAIGSSFITKCQEWSSRVRVAETSEYSIYRKWLRNYSYSGGNWTPTGDHSMYFRLDSDASYRTHTPWGALDTLLWGLSIEYDYPSSGPSYAGFICTFNNQYRSVVSSVGRHHQYQNRKLYSTYNEGTQSWDLTSDEITVIATCQLFDDSEPENPFEDTRNQKLEQAFLDTWLLMKDSHTDDEWEDINTIYTDTKWVSIFIEPESSRSSSSRSSESSLSSSKSMSSSSYSSLSRSSSSNSSSSSEYKV